MKRHPSLEGVDGFGDVGISLDINVICQNNGKGERVSLGLTNKCGLRWLQVGGSRRREA
jgi:hypothetical protein